MYLRIDHKIAFVWLFTCHQQFFSMPNAISVGTDDSGDTE